MDEIKKDFIIKIEDFEDLSEIEKKIINDFISKIDITNSNVVLQYGDAAQQKIANFSDSFNQTFLWKDSDEFSLILTNSIFKLKNFNSKITKYKISKFIGVFIQNKQFVYENQILYNLYKSIETCIHDIIESFEQHQIQPFRDIAMLGKMHEMNLAYITELTMYIIAGKKKLSQEKNTTLVDLQEKARNSRLPEYAQVADDFVSMCNRFEKKLYDLEQTRDFSLKVASQIRMIQNNREMIINKIHSFCIHAIPLWKNNTISFNNSDLYDMINVKVLKKENNILISDIEEILKMHKERWNIDVSNSLILQKEQNKNNKNQNSKGKKKMNMNSNNNSIKTVFLSYCSFDTIIADIVESAIYTQIDNIKISRYTRDVGYRESFKDFMNSVGKHDFVVTIVSNKYLKSRACMYEVGELIKDHDFQKKIIFIILSDKDKIHYENTIDESIQAGIYDPIERNKYIIYWENEYKILDESTKQINSDFARIESLKIMQEIKKIIDYDLGQFLSYLSDANGLSFSELYDTNFSEIISIIDPSKKK